MSLRLAPKPSVRVLGVRVDPQLRWGEHVKKVTDKMKTQTNALARTTASTWGATLATARQIYSAVIRPAMAYGAAVWHSNPDGGRTVTTRGRRPGGPAQKLNKIQNKCLWIVARVYKATPI